MIDIINKVRQFTEAVGCTTDRYNVRQTALYIGLQLEEMAEKLTAIFPAGTETIHSINLLSIAFKKGTIDELVAVADRAAMLDADIDLAWVTIGSALSQGADVEGAAGEVARANMSKLVMCDNCYGTGSVNRYNHESGQEYAIGICEPCNGLGLVAIKDDNGKVRKPDSFTPPDITPFICKEEV